MCSACQPVILAGDFNAEPTVIPSLAKGIFDGHWIDLERAFATSLLILVSSNSTKIRVLVGILFWHVLLLWRLQLRVLFCQTAGSLFILLFMRSFLSLLGMVLLNGLGFILPFGLLVGLIALIALGLLSRMRFEISGMFTFERLALFLARSVKSFSVCATPLM